MDQRTNSFDMYRRPRSCRRNCLFGQLISSFSLSLSLFSPPLPSSPTFPLSFLSSISIFHCICTCVCISHNFFFMQVIVLVASLPSWLSLGLVMIWYLLKFVTTLYTLAHSQPPLSKKVSVCVCVLAMQCSHFLSTDKLPVIMGGNVFPCKALNRVCWNVCVCLSKGLISLFSPNALFITAYYKF